MMLHMMGAIRKMIKLAQTWWESCEYGGLETQ